LSRIGLRHIETVCSGPIFREEREESETESYELTLTDGTWEQRAVRSSLRERGPGTTVGTV
jgi:hypothetical protein